MVSNGETASAQDGGLTPAHALSAKVDIRNLTSPANDVGNGHPHTSGTISMETGSGSDSTADSSPAEDSVEMTRSAIQPGAETDAHVSSSRKRKSLDHSTGPDETWPREKQKKVKLDSELAEDPANQHVHSRVTDSSLGRDKSLLPPEVWHHIFTFCPPKSLGNLLRVNKLFNHYLDPSSSVRSGFPVSMSKKCVLSPLKPNAIWQASRRLYWPHMPAPLRSKTELDMWRLVCSPVCQNCKKPDARDQPNQSDPWRSGPGPNGVAVIWPFATRMCVSCLLKTSIKEVDILLSPTIPNAILPALPFVLLGQDLVIIPATVLESGQLPTDLQVTRLYSSSDVEALEKEFSAVKDMGPGTVDEWLKGLKGRGNDLRHEASKWEKWESSGGLAKMCSQLYPGYEPSLVLPPDVDLSANSRSAGSSNGPSISTTPTNTSFQSHHERTIDEIAELKAARKSEIEHRAMSLEPAITKDVLHQLPAFRAATQIIAPLDDRAWDLLKVQLLAQRADAERREKEPVERQLEATLATTKEARDLIDKEWEEIQAPVRAKIAGYADEIIREKWDKGRKVSKDSCPKFATEVLIHVRKRFYEHVAKDAAAARASGRSPVIDPPEGPFTQKLTLENMKWIFDTKIKPHTEAYRKELFYCNGCEGNYKTFGFEGVVQHYAAKHTSALSVGSIVVHWRAEWPEHPPFASEGRPAKHQPFFGHNPAQGPFHHATPLPPNTFHYQPPPAATVPQIFPPPLAPGGYGAPPYPEHYPQPSQPYSAQPTYPPPFVPPAGYGSHQPYAPSPSPYPSYQHPTGPYPPPPIGGDPATGYAPPPSGNYMYNYGSHQSHPQGAYPVPPSGPYPDTYQTKLEDIARNSREVWHALGSLKDLPGSGRIFATIHHLVKRYRARFYETPPLTMFIDGLSNNKDMRPVRNINSLVCKACYLGLGNAASVEQDRKNFSLPQLANHFQSKHIEPMQHMNPQLDWVVDMVLPPDVDVISGLLSSASESQKGILTDAFSEALRSRHATVDQQSYEHPQAQTSVYPNHSGDPQDRFYERQPPPETTRIPTNGEGYHTDRQHLEPYAPTGYSAPPQDSRPGIPPVETRSSGYLPDRSPVKAEHEHDQAPNNAGGRHSPRGSQPNRHQNGAQNQKKRAGKNKRVKPQERNESSKRVKEEEEATRMDENQARREAEEIQAMWAADRAYLSNKPDQQESNDKPLASQTLQQPRTRTPQIAQPPRKSVPPPAASRPKQKESSLIAALEMHLDQGHRSERETHQPTPSGVVYPGNRSSGLPTDGKSASRTYARYEEENHRPRSPAPYKDRYYQPTPAPAPPVRERSPRPQQPEPGYYSRPAPPVERNEASYDGYRARSEYPEQQYGRHPEDRRYDMPPHRRLDDHGHEIAPRRRSDDPGPGHEVAARPEYLRYAEDGPAPSRGPVELYEIVQVIDERGEYFIRRPVRREAEAVRYVYEEGGRYRDGDGYGGGYEHVRVPPVPPRGGQLEGRRGDLRDPAYQEEYDPRFPGV